MTDKDDKKEMMAQEEPPKFHVARLPWHPSFETQFKDIGVNKGSWRTLVEAVWPGAKTVESVQMALSYCVARKLDPFKRPVHIVPMWSAAEAKMVETVWPGIAELRTTASRTGTYAGMERTEFGPDVTEEFASDNGERKVKVTFPTWAACTVIRTLNGVPMKFPGPIVRFKETYAVESRKSDIPNSMWLKRPYGQLEKCAEAAALRRAFPEELGNDYTAEEMDGQPVMAVVTLTEPSITAPPAKAPPPPPPVKTAAEKVADENQADDELTKMYDAEKAKADAKKMAAHNAQMEGKPEAEKPKAKPKPAPKVKQPAFQPDADAEDVVETHTTEPAQAKPKAPAPKDPDPIKPAPAPPQAAVKTLEFYELMESFEEMRHDPEDLKRWVLATGAKRELLDVELQKLINEKINRTWEGFIK